MGSLIRSVSLALIIVFIVTFSLEYTQHIRTLSYLKNDSYKYIINDSLNRGTLRLNGLIDSNGNQVDITSLVDEEELERAIVKHEAYNLADVSSTFTYDLYEKDNVLYLKININGVESITKFSIEESNL